MMTHDDNVRRVLAVVRHPVGGVRTHIVYTYRLLLSAGYRFTFVIPAHESSATFIEQVSTWDGVEIFEAPYRDRRRRTPAFRPVVRRLLRCGEFSLIHSHGVQAAMPSMFANIGFGLPHVMTSQDVFHRVRFSGVVDRLKLYALGQLLRRLDVLIAVSEDTREDHLQYLPVLRKGPCRVEMIHNGIPVDHYANPNGQPPAYLRKRLGLGANVFLMGFLGRFMEQKGFLVLIEALSLLLQRGGIRPFHLVAVGSGDMLVNYQRELTNKPELSGRLSFLEHTPDPAPILRELDLLVMPSLWEAHPLLPMEAMVMGIPVLGTSCLGLREALAGSPNATVRPGCPDELAKALENAIAYPWSEAAHAYVPMAIGRFDVRRTAEQLRSLFDELTGEDQKVPRQRAGQMDNGQSVPDRAFTP